VAGPFVAVPARQAQGRLGNRLEQSQRDGVATGATVAVAAGVHPDEGQLDVGEGPSRTGRQQLIDFAESEYRLPSSGVGRDLLPAARLEVSELLAAEEMLLLEGRPQRGKPGGERIAGLGLHLIRLRAVNGGRT
jgi:hypothetical protein